MAALPVEPEGPRGRTAPRLLLGLLILMVLGAAAYATYTYRDDLQSLFTVATDDGATPTPPAEAAAPRSEPTEVEEVPGSVIFYTRLPDGLVRADRGSVTWTFVADPAGPHLAVRIEVPERGLAFDLVMRKATDATPGASHVIEVVAGLPADFAANPVQSILELAAKSSEEAIGTAIVATMVAIEPNHFAIELSADSAGRNMSQMRQEWFDLGIGFADGEQAILSFNKGTAGHEAMRDALAAWGA